MSVCFVCLCRPMCDCILSSLSRGDPAKPSSHVLSVCLFCLSVLSGPLAVSLSVCIPLCDSILCSLGETLLSPLVMCGPHGLKFLQAVELRLPHCASVNPDSWSFALKSSDSPTGRNRYPHPPNHRQQIFHFPFIDLYHKPSSSQISIWIQVLRDKVKNWKRFRMCNQL